jgi:hypothetical protein
MNKIIAGLEWLGENPLKAGLVGLFGVSLFGGNVKVAMLCALGFILMSDHRREVVANFAKEHPLFFASIATFLIYPFFKSGWLIFTAILLLIAAIINHYGAWQQTKQVSKAAAVGTGKFIGSTISEAWKGASVGFKTFTTGVVIAAVALAMYIYGPREFSPFVGVIGIGFVVSSLLPNTTGLGKFVHDLFVRPSPEDKKLKFEKEKSEREERMQKLKNEYEEARERRISAEEELRVSRETEKEESARNAFVYKHEAWERFLASLKDFVKDGADPSIVGEAIKKYPSDGNQNNQQKRKK